MTDEPTHLHRQSGGIVFPLMVTDPGTGLIHRVQVHDPDDAGVLFETRCGRECGQWPTIFSPTASCEVCAEFEAAHS